jgi:hypothetical protein
MIPVTDVGVEFLPGMARKIYFSGIWCSVVLLNLRQVSGEHIASVFIVANQVYCLLHTWFLT